MKSLLNRSGSTPQANFPPFKKIPCGSNYRHDLSIPKQCSIFQQKNMSEFTNHQKIRLETLHLLFSEILRKGRVKELYEQYKDILDRMQPADVVLFVHQQVEAANDMPRLKTAINKLLNLLYKPLTQAPSPVLSPDSYLGIMKQNNVEMAKILGQLKPFVKQINQHPANSTLRQKATELLQELSRIDSYYAIKENVLFPLIEKHLPEFRCLAVMWSIHDDIRRNLKETIALLSHENIDLARMNRLLGDLFFDLSAIRFREEKILFPVIATRIPENELEALFLESADIGFPWVQPPQKQKSESQVQVSNGKIDLKTGTLTAEQIRLIFNHLPVDVTFVDENNKVCYYSTPPKRIFRRTNAILGRDVHNCHPPESVHVVEQIVEAFRSGQKDSASFWIDMNGEKLLIQYFAIRDENGNYKGVVEVTQEITNIQQLQGQKRLLDWED